MIKLAELCRFLDLLLKPGDFADSSVNGLQVEGSAEIGLMATAVTANLASIEAAVKLKAQALIVHHGLFWSGDSFVISGVKKEKLKLLLENGISLLAYHIPLDAHVEIGNNWKAAKDMGWKDLEPFGDYRGAKIGVKGRISATEATEFQKQLERYYNHSAVCALGGRKKIETVALVSGGAYRSTEEASKAKIDGFVTGNFDEPAWHMAFEGEVNFYALGHTATERVGPRALGGYLQQELKTPCVFIDTDNPF